MYARVRVCVYVRLCVRIGMRAHMYAHAYATRVSCPSAWGAKLQGGDLRLSVISSSGGAPNCG